MSASDLSTRSRLPGGPDGRLGRFAAVVAATDTRRLVLLTALAAFLMRFPGLLWPIRPDEAGFTLVARHWHPQPDSLYGDYFVDRPPPIIAVVKLSDWIGGPFFIRFLAALACAALVLLAARTAYVVAGDRAARWTAVTTAAVTGNAMIDAVAAKGEILGIPFVVGSCLLALEALRVLATSRRKALLLAFAAGLVGMAAVGLKQNMVTGLVFGAVLLLASGVRREVGWPDVVRLSAAALIGAAIPVLLTVGWCLAVGVELQTLWYTVFGFRSDALDVISDGSTAAPALRILKLFAIFVATGMGILLFWFVRHLRTNWAAHASVSLATVVVVGVDLAGLVLGGSYWRTYLLGLVPGMVLAVALLSARRDRVGEVSRRVSLLAVVSCLLALLGWVANNLVAVEPPTEIYTGHAVRDVAEPGDTIVVFGGRSDIVMASGLESPYEHLWSLPMRTLDPDLDELTALLDSDRRPTWFVEWVSFDAWNGSGDRELEDAVARNYVRAGTGCDDTTIYVRRDVTREAPVPDCSRSWLWTTH